MLYANSTASQPSTTRLPQWVAIYAERLASARGDAARVLQVLAQASVPIVLLDDDRRYVKLNAPAVSLLGVPRAELERMRLDDLTPPYLLPDLKQQWVDLMETGCVVGPPERARAESTQYLGMTTFALANVLPRRHALAFAPPGWPVSELPADPQGDSPGLASPLTPRELEVLQLAAAGCNGPMIAEQLVVSPATVRTHFDNIYAKLGAHDRAAAVAVALRLGLID
jgi:DNA-binding CsgD family transcriptional regulator